jgi:hypothetical protein
MDLVIECARCGVSYARPLLGPDPVCRRCGTPLLGPSATPGQRGNAGPPLRTRADATPPLRTRADAGTPLREEVRREEANLRELQRLAERVCFLIVATDTPRIDVDIQRAEVRRRCLELFPDKMHVFDLVYESRFRRLWDQFRAA